VNEEAMAHWGLSRQKQTNKLNDSPLEELYEGASINHAQTPINIQ